MARYVSAKPEDSTVGSPDSEDAGNSMQEADIREAQRGRVASGAARSGSPTKRAGLGAGESASETSVAMDELSAMRAIGDRVRKFVFTDKVTKAASELLLRCVSEYEEQMMRMIARNERLSGRIEECERMLAHKETKASYASVTGGSADRAPGSKAAESLRARDRVNAKTYAVVVKPKDDGSKMTSDEVKEKVLRNVSGELNIRVKAVRKTRGGGLAIEAASEGEVKMLRECEKFGALGLKVEAPKKVGPKVILFDVENEMTNDELVKEIFTKNLKNAGVSFEEYKERTRIVSRSNKKGMKEGNVIMEVSKKVRDLLVREGRAYVRWRACKVKEFVHVLRCHKCFAYGHMMKECSVDGRLCEKCGESGHLKEGCKNACICRNCKNKGRKCDHSVLATDCPEYVKMLDREKARVSDD